MVSGSWLLLISLKELPKACQPGSLEEWETEAFSHWFPSPIGCAYAWLKKVPGARENPRKESRKTSGHAKKDRC